MPLNIYFSCSITGGRKDQQDYQAIVDALVSEGHSVPTAHLSSPEVMALEAVVDPVEVFTRDIEWIDACEAVVAEVSTPSHGVGYEIAYALGRGKPVLCCYRQEVRVSKMITGNTHPLLRLRSYQSAAEAVQLVCEFLLDISKRRQTTLDTNVNKITWNQ
ncbi:MAG TPA: nucleoside 2-deoxyribosyltransferase [Anaerolineales bacterium]|nr:nucleoside 2-deoxyribosyltransferase [Anaerolineales bacterium]